jgi:hypothetical protein
LFSFKAIEVFGKAVLDEGGALLAHAKAPRTLRIALFHSRLLRSLVRPCWMREVLKLAHAKAPRALRV